MKKNYVRPLDIKRGYVDLTHGAGGRAMTQLVEELFLKAFDNPYLHPLNDQALLPAASQRLVVSTDSHVVTPLFFPGGDIGSLSVHGTINDLAVGGARPLYLTAGFILEEGFPLTELKKIIDSMARAAKDAGVPVVAGDTKVVEKGHGDGVFINTTGIGVLPEHVAMGTTGIADGDKIIVSGFIGDHGIAVMAQRENLSFETTIISDSAPLHELVEVMLKTVPTIHCMRDPTRGGLGIILNELAHQSGMGMLINEWAVPVRDEVRAACEFLGLDPFYVANEGKLVAICPTDHADTLVDAMHQHPLGKDAAIIGNVQNDPDCFVELETSFGGKRIVDWLSADQLPRIC